MNPIDFLSATVLGIVEGLTEFLPISSTGHLILFNQWFKFESVAFTNMFNIVIQSGAILAVILSFRKRLFPVYKSQDLVQKQAVYQLWLKAFIAFVPTAVIAFLGSDFIDTYLFKPGVVIAALAFWGIVIIVIERFIKGGRLNQRYDTVADLTIPVVLAIGFIQCLGMIPGTSRSAATIIGALLLGASRVAAVEFSFFLGIPTLLAAGAYSLYKQLRAGLVLGLNDILVLITGLVVSFVVAWAVIAFLMRFIQKRDFEVFGWYRIGLAVVVLIVFGLINVQL